MKLALALPVLALAGCGKDAAQHDKPASAAPAAPPVDPASRKIDKLEMTVPAGWTSSYDAGADKLVFEVATAGGTPATARIERAPATWVASPDAYLAQRKRYDLGPGTKAEIEKREGVKDGFAMTVVVTPPADRGPPRRETYVVRQLGSAWYQCVSERIPDDAVRDQLVALCKSLKI